MHFEPVWGVPIALYLFLAGLGGGAFITSALASRWYPEATTVRKIGYFIAPVVVAVGLVLLMVDAKGGLFHPLRFALLLHNFHSVMTWGVVFLAIFEVVALIVAILEIMKKNIPGWLVGIGFVFALAVAAYTGVLLGVVKTFPLWNNPLLPVLFVVSALSTGAAAVFVGALFACHEQFERMWKLKQAHFVLPVAEVVLVIAMLFIVSFQSDAARETVVSLVAGRFALAFWLGFVIIGLIFPICVEAYELFVVRQAEEAASTRYLSIASEIGVLIGGFLLRLLIVIAALPVVLLV